MMKLPSQKLREFIERKIDEIPIDSTVTSYQSIQDIARRLDFISLTIPNSEKLEDEEMILYKLFFDFGWAPLLKKYYDDINLDVHQPYTLMNVASKTWVDSLVNYYGKLSFCKQILAYEKADLIKITGGKGGTFYYEYLYKNGGFERFDRISRDFYREQIIERIIEDKKKKKGFNEKRVEEELRSIVKSPDGKMITYNSTPYIDEFYNEEGYYHLLRLQGYDDFDPKDSFGGIEYHKYLDILELVIGVALKHVSACLELVKMNDQIDLHNILSYTCYKDKTIANFSDYVSVDKAEIEQIFSCLMLTKDSFAYYLDYPRTPAPMYFQVSENLLIRSVAGCLGNPIDLLNRELKRKYQKDYDRAVNRREDRFRKELFNFFPDEHIIKIPREIRVSFDGIKTDIDAVVFDVKNRTLGLFQLKWQDSYAHSMVERYSRMKNLFPKANEWIIKMRQWVSSHDEKSLLSSLLINDKLDGDYHINNICVFVLSRNQMNYTGIEDLDETVAWGSWHQLIESQARVQTQSDDLIVEMFTKLKAFSPSARMDRGEVSCNTEVSVIMGDHSIHFKDLSK